jgi:RNase P/RNase MRP subunit POP5
MKSKLKPSAKIHRRYILLDAKNKNEIESTILEYIGILGWSKASPIFVDSEKHYILAVKRESLIEVRAAFEVSNKEIKILKVSGTLAGLEK